MKNIFTAAFASAAALALAACGSSDNAAEAAKMDAEKAAGDAEKAAGEAEKAATEAEKH